jgi:hypothetical protein
VTTTEYVDEVAVRRALDGDRAVWTNLTRPERAETLARIHARRLAEMAENREWSKILRNHAYGNVANALPHSHERPEWLESLASVAGYKNGETLLKAARDRSRREA